MVLSIALVRAARAEVGVERVAREARVARAVEVSFNFVCHCVYCVPARDHSHLTHTISFIINYHLQDTDTETTTLTITLLPPTTTPLPPTTMNTVTVTAPPANPVRDPSPARVASRPRAQASHPRAQASRPRAQARVERDLHPQASLEREAMAITPEMDTDTTTMLTTASCQKDKLVD